MTKNDKPVLRLKVRGPGVRRGRISIPDLIKLCQETQSAVKKQAEALEGRKTIHPGPVSVPIQEECTLDLIGIKKGSTTLEFAFSKEQLHLPVTEALGTEAISELALSIKSLGDGNKRSIDPGVLQSVYNLGSLAETKGISEIEWIAPHSSGKGHLSASLNATVRRKAAQRLSAPQTAAMHVDGVLEMVDFKPEDRRCRIDPPIGAPVPCTFDPELADAVQQLLRQTVRGHGVARLAPYTARVEVLHLTRLDPLPSTALGHGNFFRNVTLNELAESQNVKPLTSSSLVGAIPDDQDVDAFLAEIYCSRK